MGEAFYTHISTEEFSHLDKIIFITKIKVVGYNTFFLSDENIACYMFKEANNQVKSSVKSMIYMNNYTLLYIKIKNARLSLWVFYCLIANKICYFISTINKEKNTTTFSFLNSKVYQVIYKRMYNFTR